jgi:predicted ribosome-associated RNA-binding protein Tma20
MNPHRRWLLALPVRGTLVLDSGASKAVASKSSLLAAGVLDVQGRFMRDEAVSLVSADTGAEIARALMNLDAAEIAKIKGLKSKEYAAVLGFQAEAEIAYTANIIMIFHDMSKFILLVVTIELPFVISLCYLNSDRKEFSSVLQSSSSFFKTLFG